MPRTARCIKAGLIYHVINRGNGQMRIFFKDRDFQAFLKVLAEGQRLYPVQMLGYCLMNNHWHLVLRPKTDVALSQFMSWVGVTHVRRHHAHYHRQSGGHLYQGRFKSFPVQDDFHLLTMLRYVEANARRAGLVKRAEMWEWSSLWQRAVGEIKDRPALAVWPVQMPRNWVELVNEVMSKAELERLRLAVNRGRPFGNERWTRNTVEKLGLDYTMRPRGRPRRHDDEKKE